MNKRYNIFNQYHKALRGMLYDTALQIQRTDFTIDEESTAALEKLELSVLLIHAHDTHEGEFILRELAHPDNFLINAIENEAEAVANTSSTLREVLADYSPSLKPAVREQLGVNILTSFNQFLVATLSYMNRKETELNKLLWKQYADRDIVAIEDAITSTMPADIRFIENNWMLKSSSNTEITEWLNRVKENASDFKFDALLELAERVLPEERWTKIRERVSEGAMVA